MTTPSTRRPLDLTPLDDAPCTAPVPVVRGTWDNRPRVARVEPAAAFYQSPPGEFLLMYDDVRATSSPDDVLMTFFQTTYEAGADLAGWNRRELEAAR